MSYAEAWSELRSWVEQRHETYSSAGESERDKETAAAIAAAYQSVLRMMDSIKKAPRSST